MERLLLIIHKILGSKPLVVNRALALVDSSRLPASQVLDSSHLVTSSRILPGKHLVTSTISVARTLAGRTLAITRALALTDSSRLAINPALASLAASRIHKILLSNSSLAVRVNLPSLLHNRFILGHSKTSSPGKRKLLTSAGKEVTCPLGRLPNTIKVNHSLVKIRLLFPIMGS